MTSLEITGSNGFPDIVKIAAALPPLQPIVRPSEKYLIKSVDSSHSYYPIGLIWALEEISGLNL